MPERHRRYFLRDRETKNLLSRISNELRSKVETFVEGKTDIEIVEYDTTQIFLIGKKPLLARIGEKVIPTLRYEEYLRTVPRVVVDMGAIPYVCKGANIMAPGIRQLIGHFKKDDIVLVVDEKYAKPLALGEALYDEDDAVNIKQGAIVKNVHYVGDRIWNLAKNVNAITQ